MLGIRIRESSWGIFGFANVSICEGFGFESIFFGGGLGFAGNDIYEGLGFAGTCGKFGLENIRGVLDLKILLKSFCVKLRRIFEVQYKSWWFLRRNAA